jgi:O-methyltransferase involved in polyketide biosynthesis
MYLTKPAVMAVLKELVASVGRFSLSLDYLSEEIIAGTTGDRATSDFVNRFAAMGAPWRLGFNDLDAVAAEAGLTVVDVVSIGELHRALWPDQPADWTIDKHYFLCTLKHAAPS